MCESIPEVSMRALAIPFVAALALSGCKKDPEDSNPPLGGAVDPPCDSGNTVDTGCYKAPPPARVYAEMRLIGFIAWDAVAGEIRPYSFQGSERTSRLEFRLYEDGIDSEFCIVGIDLAGYNIAPDAKANGFIWGVDMPAGDKPWFETCTADGFDTDQFGENAHLMEDIAAWAVSLRMSSGLSADLEDWLNGDPDDPDFVADEWTGGDFSVEGDPISTDASSNYWYGFDVDANFDVDPDTAAPKLTSSTLVDGNGDLTSGYYVFDQNVFWDFRP